MLLPYGTMIKNDVIEAFNAAVANPENIHQGGGINWDFVESDLQIGLGVIYNSDYLNDCFAVLVDRYFA